MKRRRWVIGAMAVAGLVALVAPAVGQGKADSASLRWTGSRRGTTLTSYRLGAIDGGAHVSKAFRLWNSGPTRSGKLSIGLTGSSAFSIALDGCAKRSLGQGWCLVAVAYTPRGNGTRDRATLEATDAQGAIASLSLSGRSGGPAGHVYWTDSLLGYVKSALRGGGTVKTLVGPPTDQYQYVNGMAVDATHVYWTDFSDGAVKEVPLGGGRVRTLATVNGPGSIAVDGRYVYWTDYSDGTVNKVPVGGGSVTTLASGQWYAGALAVHGTSLYWVNDATGPHYDNGTVTEVPIGGGSVTTLASGQLNPTALAVDGTNVYWVNDGGTVNEVPVGGGSVTTLASRENGPVSIAVEGTHVYWANFGDGMNGTVNEVPRGGGRVRTLAVGQSGPTSVAVDRTHAYWVNYNGTVNKVRLGGGRVITIASGFYSLYPFALAVGP